MQGKRYSMNRFHGFQKCILYVQFSLVSPLRFAFDRSFVQIYTLVYLKYIYLHFLI